MNNHEFETLAIHGGAGNSLSHSPSLAPVYDSASFEYDDAESMQNVFQGRKFGHVYSRISNPTVSALEQRITVLEQGLGSIAVSSGMAAITTALLTLTEQGDRIVASKGLFSGTALLLNDIFKDFGVEICIIDPHDEIEVREALAENAKCLFVESITNPGLAVPNIRSLAKIAEEFRVPLVIDSTLTTPYLLKAKELGAAVVVHSLTKFLTGNGSVVGGVLVDLGNYNWQESPIKKINDYSKRAGEYAFLACARKRILQNTGACLAPSNARQHILGIETLPLRMERHCLNALELAWFLSAHEKITVVNYPGLKSSPSYAAAESQFRGGFGGVLTIRLGSREKCFLLIKHLKLAKNMANIGDVRTLVIHPASTIFHEYTAAERNDAGVYDDLVRISAGIENIKDIIIDFKESLAEV
ncbi:MAG: O-acetylhomoserine aminocarboxypropyltransferase/cysteine synthase [bacterium]|nr:O-acetylhomoserine aminocarboxypropyltransferase/cysteine synthase [bacterium]